MDTFHPDKVPIYIYLDYFYIIAVVDINPSPDERLFPYTSFMPHTCVNSSPIRQHMSSRCGPRSPSAPAGLILSSRRRYTGIAVFSTQSMVKEPQTWRISRRFLPGDFLRAFFSIFIYSYQMLFLITAVVYYGIALSVQIPVKVTVRIWYPTCRADIQGAVNNQTR